jgi:hypothetical protein
VLAVLACVWGYNAVPQRLGARLGALRSSVVEETSAIKEITCPDFYWEFRLDRLVNKKGGELEYNAASYPESKTSKALYDAYYLDLTLNGKLANFDWMGEKEVSDSEWLGIYKKICAWTAKTASSNKASTDNLPSNDFDLLKSFYPALSFRELEANFGAEEVGDNFPYKNMKEMLGAAVDGKLSVPGYDAKSITSIEADNIRAELASLKESTMKKVDDIYADAMKYAQNPFPDAKAKEHYQALRTKLADFPQSPKGWSDFRADMEKQVDEMARLASKPVDEHGHGSGPSVSEEFEAKYGKSLEEMQERFNQYKNDPEGFLEKSIMEKYGRNGVEIWKKSQEFSSSMSTMSESDKAAVEKKFSDFIGSA